MENKKELKPIFSNQKSFYKKAFTIEDETKIILQSYKVNVAMFDKIENRLFIYGYYSKTTAVHINEFIQQLGFKKMNKEEILEAVGK